jgi:protein O-GlcNAc transferase
LARIAKDAGPSEFWLASANTHPWATAKVRDRLAAAFRAEGLDPDAHLRVMPWLPRAQFAGFLDEMDVYLDCPAFSGYTTAWAAVHRGLPIVTREGEFLRQRLAAGLLRQIGITDGIAMTGDQYVQIATRWAEECRQSDLWAARREEILRAAPMADGNRSAVRAFEQVLLSSSAARS